MPARFHDGESAAGRPARLTATDLHLIIAAEGVPDVAWALTELRVVQVTPDGRVTLAPRKGDARLVASREDLPPTVLARVRFTAPAGRGWLRLGLAVGVSLAVIVGIVVAAPAWLAPLIPRSWQAPLGNHVLALLELSGKRCAGPGLAPLAALTGRLAAAAGVPPITLTVLDDKTINAVTLPGDRVVVFRGLIDAADGDELAGVLGHELGHVRHHDAMKPIIRQFGFSVLMLATGGGDGGLSGIGRDLANLSFSRSAEAAADASAIETLHTAGLRADGLARFFKQMEHRANGQEVPRWLATHPANDARATAALAQAGDGGAPALTEDALASIKHVCAGPLPSAAD